jgi:hypothetical protein
VVNIDASNEVWDVDPGDRLVTCDLTLEPRRTVWATQLNKLLLYNQVLRCAFQTEEIQRGAQRALVNQAELLNIGRQRFVEVVGAVSSEFSTLDALLQEHDSTCTEISKRVRVHATSQISPLHRVLAKLWNGIGPGRWLRWVDSGLNHLLSQVPRIWYLYAESAGAALVPSLVSGRAAATVSTTLRNVKATLEQASAPHPRSEVGKKNMQTIAALLDEADNASAWLLRRIEEEWLQPTTQGARIIWLASRAPTLVVALVVLLGLNLFAPSILAMFVWATGRLVSQYVEYLKEVRVTQADPNVDEVKHRLAAIENQVRELLLTRGILPVLREHINTRLSVVYGKELRIPIGLPNGLHQLPDTDFEVPPVALDQVRSLMQSMGSGSIGISGPRGIGKSTLMRWLPAHSAFSCEEGTQPLTVAVAAPVEYSGRDFVLHMFGELCRQIRRRYETASPRQGDVHDRSLGWARMRGFLRSFAMAAREIAAVFAIAYGVSLLAASALESIHIPQIRILLHWWVPGAASAATLLHISLACGGIVLMIRRPDAVLSVGMLSAIWAYFRSQWQWIPVTLPIIAKTEVSIGASASELRPLGGIVVHAVGLTSHDVGAAIPPGMLLTTVILLAIVASTTSTSLWTGSRILLHTRLKAVMSSVLITSCLIIIAFPRLSRTVAPVDLYPLIAVGAMLVGVFLVLRLRWQTGNDKLMDESVSTQSGTIALGEAAEHRLRRIRYQQSLTNGWTGTVKLPALPVFPLLAEGGVTREVVLQELPQTLPEIVSDFRDFVCLVHKAVRSPIIVCIDELDKIRTPENAEQFLNEIKAVFGLPGTFYIVSVSEDVMTRFELRGLPFRDNFDSSFDEVIRIDYLTFADARRFVNRRVVGVPVVFQALAYVMSGGLPRDLVRTTRGMVIRAAEGDISAIAADMVRRELASKARVIMATVAQGGAAALSILEWCGALQPDLADHDSLLRHIEQAPLASTGDLDAKSELADNLARELASFEYFCSTVLAWFTQRRDDADVGRAEAVGMGTASFDQLASCRQAFSLSAAVAWARTSAFRREWGLLVRDFPGTA